ncbi:mitochondrial import inner membrane translocase subunit TIM50-like [Carica papaya]|uniref:mitochondrial import inner membrane translocase subunit TIM50-like n=1 Tax=Carica papaya TaxID=3649 RepID=UPI000B8CB213|nr:mitochondrial import inner membrane translocase subunit TIM50-like [Carica papaya]
MNSTILRSRISSGLSKIKSNNPRLFSVEVPPLESSQARPIIAVGEEFATDPNSSSKKPTPEGAPQVSKPLRFLKYGLIGALTGATAAAGYVSYAYTLEEVDQKTKALRESVNYKVGDDSSTMDVSRVKALSSDKLLPDLHPAEQHVFTLVLDLNETLLYSDWKRDRGWKTFKRPGVDIFLEHLAKFYEIIVYSDQMEMYVVPVCDRLDPNHYIRYRLARGATNYVNGKHYRDLSKLNRDPAKVLYVSGHAFDSTLQPENCVPIKPYKLESDDTALLDLIPFLEFVARNSPADIRTVLSSYERNDIAKEFLERSKEYQRRMQEQRSQKRFWQR